MNHSNHEFQSHHNIDTNTTSVCTIREAMEEPNEDILDAFYTEGECEQSHAVEDENSAQESRPRKKPDYNPKKPKWWVKLCGKPTKAQKRATLEVFETHRMPIMPYGEIFNWSEILPPDKEIWMELGFGRGENLLALAHRKRNENIALVGVEIHKPGMATACQRILMGMKESSYWSDYVLYSPELDPYSDGGGDGRLDQEPTVTDEVEAEGGMPSCEGASRPYENLRLYPGDSMKYMPHVPSNSVTAILITFPDPFPRDHEMEWRLVQRQTLQAIHRVLRKGEKSGRLYLATDHDGYHEWCHSTMKATNEGAAIFKEIVPCPDRVQWLPAISRYEQKGWHEGRSTKLSCWEAL